MRLSRRSFLATLGGAAACTAAGSAIYRAMGQPAPEAQSILADWQNHEEQFFPSICQQCSGGCGVLARVVDGNVVRISGNPLHPVNQGGLCVRGMAGLQALHDPDRLRSPLARDGKRGEGKWKSISWDEALNRVSEELVRLRAHGKAHTAAVLGGDYRGMIDQVFRRFCEAYGTPNYLRLRDQDFEKGSASGYYMQGLQKPLVYDLEHSQYILSFGCNLLETWMSPVNQQKAYGRLRDRTAGDRATFVMVDPRLSVTASKADRWLPIRPGTDAALALGLAYIIIQEGRYDRDFVRDLTFGFEEWTDASGTRHQGFKQMVLDEYPPDKVAEITGIPVERLFEVARGFAASRPALALGERGPAFRSNDVHTRMAIHSLNALVGSIGQPGGVAVQGTLPFKAWPAVKTDAVGHAGLAHPRIDRLPGRPSLALEHTAHRMPANVLAGSPYEINALLVYYTNPVFSLPNGQDWARALDKIPFVVSFSPFMDETTQQADLILPDCTTLERWRDDEVTHLAGISAYSVGAPAVPPLYDTRPSEDVMLQLARKVGGPVAAALPWDKYSDLLRDRAQGLYEAGRGHVVMPLQEEELEQIQARQGYWRQEFASYGEFWDELVRKGTWWDPNDTYVGPRQLVQTPSRKVEFYSQILHAELSKLSHAPAAAGHAKQAAGLDSLAPALGIHVHGDRMFMPHYGGSLPAQSPQDFPYILNAYKLLAVGGGRSANQPWLQQQPAVHVDGGWDSWLEINPATAAGMGIADGDPVVLESAQGRLVVTARLFAGAAPGIVNMPSGWGHTAGGRWSKDRGQNPNTVLESWIDPMTGVPSLTGTRVRLRKA